MGWGNEEDQNYDDQGRRRKYRNRFRSDEDGFGAANAEDFYDNGSAEDLSFGQHAAGFDRDYQYEQNYADRQDYYYQGPNYGDQGYSNDPGGVPYNPPPPQYGSQQGYQGNLQGFPQNNQIPQQPVGQPPLSRAEELRNRMAQRGTNYQNRSTGDSTGIDALFDGSFKMPGLPCSMNGVMLFLVALIAVLGCLVMAILAAGSLQRLLGI